MNSILKKIELADVIKAGHVYILNDIKDRRSGLDSMDFLYFIKTDQEIIPAIDFEIACCTDYKIKKFIRWSRVNAYCVEFTFFSYDKVEKKNVMHSLFLHRIKTVQEVRQEMYED